MIAVKTKVDVRGYNAWSNKLGVPHAMPPPDVLSRMVALRINIDSSQRDNGPLLVLPGTHRWGVLAPECVRDLAASIPPVPCLTAAGGAVVMSPLLLHSSVKSTSQLHRRVLHMEFANFDLPNPLEWRDRVAP